MFSACFICNSTSVLMYRCGNPPCRKVFCVNCGGGMDHHSCPSCGNRASEGAGLLDAFVDAFIAPQHRPTSHEQSPGEDGAWGKDARGARKRKRRRGDSERLMKNIELRLDALADERDVKVPTCPNCGGDLPSDSGEKHYGVCMHCRRDLFWGGSKPFASAKEAEAMQKELEEEERQIELERAEMEAEEQEENAPRGTQHPTVRIAIPADTCLRLAAVIASVDGRISTGEFKEVFAALSKIGIPEAEAREQFIRICRTVHSDGIEKWATQLCDVISTTTTDEHVEGLTSDALITLLQQVMGLGGGDVSVKEELLRRFTSAARDRPGPA